MIGNCSRLSKGKDPGEVLAPSDAQCNDSEVVSAHHSKRNTIDFSRLGVLDGRFGQFTEGRNELHRPFANADGFTLGLVSMFPGRRVNRTQHIEGTRIENGYQDVRIQCSRVAFGRAQFRARARCG